MKKHVSHRNRAYTLFELVIVVFIMGLLIGVVLIKPNSSYMPRDLKHFTQHIKMFLEIVQEQSILQNSIIGVHFGEDSYEIYRWQSSKYSSWQPITNKHKFLKDAKYPKDFKIRVKQLANDDLLPLSVKTLDMPQLIFLPSGQITPLELTVYSVNQEDKMYLIASGAGDIRILEDADV